MKTKKRGISMIDPVARLGYASHLLYPDQKVQKSAVLQRLYKKLRYMRTDSRIRADVVIASDHRDSERACSLVKLLAGHQLLEGRMDDYNKTKEHYSFDAHDEIDVKLGLIAKLVAESKMETLSEISKNQKKHGFVNLEFDNGVILGLAKTLFDFGLEKAMPFVRAGIAKTEHLSHASYLVETMGFALQLIGKEQGSNSGQILYPRSKN